MSFLQSHHSKHEICCLDDHRGWVQIHLVCRNLHLAGTGEQFLIVAEELNVSKRRAKRLLKKYGDLPPKGMKKYKDWIAPILLRSDAIRNKIALLQKEIEVLEKELRATS